jgi:hypothetical protein
MGKKSVAIKDMHWNLVGKASFSMFAYQGFCTILYKEGWKGIIQELGSVTTHGKKNALLALIVCIAVAIYLTANALLQGKFFGNDSLFTKKNMKAGLITLMSFVGPVFFMDYMARISAEIIDSKDNYPGTIAVNYILSTIINFILMYVFNRLFKANYPNDAKVSLVLSTGITGGSTGGLLYDMLIKITHQPEYFTLQGGMGALGAAINATVGLGLHSLYDKCFGKTKNENEEAGLLVNNDMPLNDDDDDNDSDVDCCGRKRLTGNLY